MGKCCATANITPWAFIVWAGAETDTHNTYPHLVRSHPTNHIRGVRFSSASHASQIIFFLLYIQFYCARIFFLSVSNILFPLSFFFIFFSILSAYILWCAVICRSEHCERLYFMAVVFIVSFVYSTAPHKSYIYEYRIYIFCGWCIIVFKGATCSKDSGYIMVWRKAYKIFA